ncbi:U4/U6.U5 small nuclear ribonucleoprotein 27 kDa protein-like [Ostrea edulis]|uniref:U4/U6.U5 small nuclear ribonucleoprotein 27 kDa protein-like n=1 Tax=Ostrea edulis TaxID=37623 RepID=UPI0020952E5C|nr:U4/U6.U5 small nuclear ribonucleoprotein 27 kDa protein-like [Ostrea edulis]
MPRRSRSRSRSPKRERRSSKERERRRHRRSRSRSPKRKSRSPHRTREHRSRSPRHKERKEKDRERESGKTEKAVYQQPIIIDDEVEELPDDEVDMMKVMGFGNFDSTKGKKVNGNDIYVANIPKKRRYRQYMNRRGGFNRPLDFIA